MLQLATSKDDIILDSFAGGGTTAHAVIEQNKADGGSRKFILIETLDCGLRSEFSYHKKFYATVGKLRLRSSTKVRNISKPYYTGLTAWKNSPQGRVLKSDTQLAKNYLSKNEIKKLERTIGAYF
jgi:hypothetical protein